MLPIRVLHVLSGLHAGGMESMIMNYYRNINRELIQFDFLLFSPKSFYDDEAESMGAKIFRLTSRRKNPLKNYRELDLFFKTYSEYKIVHIHQGINYFAPLKKAKKYYVPHIIAHSHGMNPKLVKRQGFLFDLFTVPTITKIATDFVACSENAAKQIFGNKIHRDKKFTLIKNAIDLNKFAPNILLRGKIRNELNINDNYVIGHVGNFTYPKNHTFIIDIFEEVSKLKDNVVLLLVGSGALQREIMEKVKKIGLEEKVYFLGNRKNVNEIMQAMDLILFPSHYEGLPVVLIESQAAGLKVLASDSIDREVKVSDLLDFLPLQKGSLFWAEYIVNNMNQKLESNYFQNQLTLSGYNILEESKKLEAYYVDMYRDRS